MASKIEKLGSLLMSSARPFRPREWIVSVGMSEAFSGSKSREGRFFEVACFKEGCPGMESFCNCFAKEVMTPRVQWVLVVFFKERNKN